MRFLSTASYHRGMNGFLQLRSPKTQTLQQREIPLKLLRAASFHVHNWQNRKQYETTELYKSVFLESKVKFLYSCQAPIRLSYFHTSNVHKQNEKSLAIIKVLKEIKTSPAPALLLGLSGLVPFITAPAYLLYGGAFLPQIAFAQLAYGASILSFLGGVRWGFTLPESVSHELTWRNLGWSVTPSLIAWSSLLMPYSLGVLTVMFGLGGAAYVDLMYQAYPTWFKALRFCLSLVAVLSLWTSFVLSIIMEQ